MTTLQQIELIRNLKLKPDIIINIKVRICLSSIEYINILFDSSYIQGMLLIF